MDDALNISGRLSTAAGRNAPPGRVVLVGARRDTRRLIRRLGDQPWNGLPIVGFVDAGHNRAAHMRLRGRHLALHPETDPVPVLGPIESLDRLVGRARATHVMVAVSRRPSPQLSPSVDQLARSDVAIHWVSVDSGPLDLGELAGVRDGGAASWPLQWAQRHAPGWLRFRRPEGGRLSWGRIGKRLVDVGVSLVLLALLAPLFALVAVAILLTTGRPVFYKQERIGQGGKRFNIIKFRSMRTDAENETGPIWASDHDTRCTRIGDFLRHTNIDELPQLLNVLRGEMSLVGPRPERPVFVETFRQGVPDYDLRHAVPGGMTGWAQVHGWRGRTSLRKRVQYDLDYIERWTIGLDLRILLMTIQHVCWGKTSWKESKRMTRAES